MFFYVLLCPGIMSELCPNYVLLCPNYVRIMFYYVRIMFYYVFGTDDGLGIMFYYVLLCFCMSGPIRELCFIMFLGPPIGQLA